MFCFHGLLRNQVTKFVLLLNSLGRLLHLNSTSLSLPHKNYLKPPAELNLNNIFWKDKDWFWGLIAWCDEILKAFTEEELHASGWLKVLFRHVTSWQMSMVEIWSLVGGTSWWRLCFSVQADIPGILVPLVYFPNASEVSALCRIPDWIAVGW